MTRKTFRAALVVAALTPLPLLAQEIAIEDAYARAASPIAKSGAAFMTIRNTGDTDDQLIGASADIAAKVELHTHIPGDGGVMMMREDKDGFEVPAGGAAHLARGGDHVMFMGLKGPMEHGDSFPLTLTFEKAGEIEIEVPVDLERQPDDTMSHD